LGVARRVLQVNAPTLALVCDVESATGFGTFLSRFNESERKRRVGQRCPLVPHIQARTGRADEIEPTRAHMFESLSRWLCNSGVRGGIYKYWARGGATARAAERSLVRTARGEGGGGTAAGNTAGASRPPATASGELLASVRTNSQLFQFMHELW